MTHPNPVRTFESHAVVDQTLEGFPACHVSPKGQHYMHSIKTGSPSVPYVEQCLTCLWIDPASLQWWADNAVKLSLNDRARRIAVAATTEPFSFVNSTSHPDLDLDEILGQALGAASMCWVGGTGDLQFDSSRAKAVWEALKSEVDGAMEELRRSYA